MILLAIDPGKKTGWAVFELNGLVHLREVGACDGDDTRFVNKLGDWRGRIATCVIEHPEYRPGDKRSNPNDLITLMRRGAFVGGYFAAYGAQIKYEKPSAWKASVPKTIHQGRILAALRPEERHIVHGASEDTIDAVGLGLFVTGRLTRGGR